MTRTQRHRARFDVPRHTADFGGPGVVNMVAPTFDLLLINATGDRLLINSSGDFLRIN